MPASSEGDTPSSDSESPTPGIRTEPSGDSHSSQTDRHANGRRLGEVCPEVMLIMPFAVPMLLAIWLRKWLRRRFGRRTGNVLGKAAILAFGGPPLLVAFVAVLLMRLALAVLDRLDRAARIWRRA